MSGIAEAEETAPPQSVLHRFLQLYPYFRERLGSRLGSPELADDALNETYLKLSRLERPLGIRNVRSYLFRSLLNTAADQRRAGARLATAQELDVAMEIADPAPDPERAAEARFALSSLLEAVQALSERRRFILRAVRLEGRSCREVAEELGLSKRMVELELRAALDHCAAQMKGGE